MNTWSIGQRVAFGFAVVLLLVLVPITLSIVNLQRIGRSFNQVSDVDTPSLQALANVQARVNDILGTVYKHIASPSAEDMKLLEANIRDDQKYNNEDLATLEKLISDAKMRGLFDQLTAARARYRQKLDATLAASHSCTTAAESAALVAKSRAEFDPLAKAYIDLIKQLRENSRRSVDESAMATENTISVATTTSVVGGTLATVVGIALAWLIIRRVNASLRAIANSLAEASAQVSAAAGQVSASSQALAEGSSEQAASLEETSASIHEINSMASRNSEGASTARTVADSTRQSTERGAKQMQEMVGAMDAIKASSGNIAKIIKTIDEIAFQTNILALNAAVEAARAGEAGAGFAVVADEVRTLAQRAAQAARETAEKIDDSIQKSGNGAEISGKVAESLREIEAQSAKVAESIAEIASASNEQTTGLVQISTAISQMDKVTQGNASNAEETAAAADELNAQAASLEEEVAKLRRLVEGGSGAASRSMAPVAHVAQKKPVEHSFVRNSGKAMTPMPRRTAAANPDHHVRTGANLW